MEEDDAGKGLKRNIIEDEVLAKRYIGVVFGCDNVYALPIIETDDLYKAKDHVSNIIGEKIETYKITNVQYDFPQTFHSDWLNYETLRLYELPKHLWKKLYFIGNTGSCYYLVAIFSVREHTMNLATIMTKLYVNGVHLDENCDDPVEKLKKLSLAIKNQDQNKKQNKFIEKSGLDKKSKSLPYLKVKEKDGADRTDDKRDKKKKIKN
jgi:hypothetical protein